LGKQETRIILVRIIAFHDIPYVATTSVGYPRDKYQKMQKAASIEGFKIVLIDSPCPTEWSTDPKLIIELGQFAVKAGYFPVYEIKNGILTFSSASRRYKEPTKRLPVEDYLNLQGRFKFMTPEQIEALKADI